MKGIKLFFLGVMFTLLVFSTFWAGNAYASTGCFTDTNGNWAETFICWMKDSGITTGVGGGYYDPDGYVTRAQMAVFMQRLAEIPPSTGNIYINAGLNDWETVGGGTGHYVIQNPDSITLRIHGTAGAGIYGFQITPDLPATLYGRQMYTHSVKICYDATQGATLTLVSLRHYFWAGTYSDIIRIVEDTTDRTDATCREYTFPINTSLWGSDHVVLYLEGDFSDASDLIKIGATTFTLVPSSNAGVLSQDDTNENREGVQELQSIEDVPGTEP